MAGNDTETGSEPKGATPKGGKAGGTAYLNTTAGPLVYDKDGHQVDAAGWTPEINLDDVGRAARRAGHLLPPSAL